MATFTGADYPACDTRPVRRLCLLALAGVLLAACDQPDRTAFSQLPSTPAASAQPKANLPLDRLAALRQMIWSGLAPHLAGGHLEQAWGGGRAVALAGPYA